MVAEGLAIIDINIQHPRPAWKAAALALAAVILALAPAAACHGERKHVIGELTVLHPLPLEWTRLDPGLDFARLSYVRESNGRNVMLAAVRIDPARYRFSLLTAPDITGKPIAFVPQMAAKMHPLIAFNASFYLPETFKPMGLAVSDAVVSNPWSRGGGSGVLLVHDQKAHIEWAKTYKPEWTQAEFAVQAGPLVIEPGGKPGIYNNTDKLTSRTMVGLDRTGKLIVVCTIRHDDAGAELSGLDLYELMEIAQHKQAKGGLDLHPALNLDGGASTGIIINHPKLKFEIKSQNPVANAIAVAPR